MAIVYYVWRSDAKKEMKGQVKKSSIALSAGVRKTGQRSQKLNYLAKEYSFFSLFEPVHDA